MKLLPMLFLFFLVGCTGVSQQQAEGISLSFVEQHVVVFTQGEDARNPVSEYDMKVLSSVDAGKAWQVSVLVSGMVNDTLKENTLTVEVDKDSGKVIRFNGVLVP